MYVYCVSIEYNFQGDTGFFFFWLDNSQDKTVPLSQMNAK